jgi:hypothetical protein
MNTAMGSSEATSRSEDGDVAQFWEVAHGESPRRYVELVGYSGGARNGLPALRENCALRH